MWIAIAVLIVVILSVIIYLNTSKASEKKKEVEKKVYPLPKQRQFPYFYLKECQFFPDGSSRFSYSDEEITDMLERLEEAVKKSEFFRAMKISNEIIKIEPKMDKVWIHRLNSIFGEVLFEERAWNEVYSKRVVNACYGFLQTSDNVQDKSLAVKHVLLPLLLKNISALIKYQDQKVTKYHNFEVYNLLINLYYILPYREILGMISSEVLEDKCDIELEDDRYAQKTIKNFLGHVDMLRTRNTSRLQEKMESKKISNCTLIYDEKINANIICFDLNYGKDVTREKIEARFFDEKNEEIFFGKDDKVRYVDIFELGNNPTGIGKEEIVILTDQRIYSVKVRIYNDEEEENRNRLKEKLTETKSVEKSIEKNVENVAQKQLGSKQAQQEDVVAKHEDEVVEADVTEEIEEVFVNQKVEERKILMYPSFKQIKEIVANDNQLVCLKENGTVITIGTCVDSQQVATWSNILDVVVEGKAIYIIKADGTVAYVGDSSYDGAEYLYSWENIKQLIPAEKHIIGLTNNATLIAIGSNDNGQCNIEDWYDVVQLEARYHTVGLSKDGTVKATGENNFGECDVKSWKDIVQIGVGEFFTVGLNSSGKVFATGLNSCGQCNVTEWANIRRIFVSGKMTVGLRYDGRVVTAGKNIYRFDDAKKWTNIKEIYVTENRIIGIEQDGTVRATGKPLKEFVSGNWSGVKSVAVNKDSIVGLKEDGTLLSNGLVFGQNLASELQGVKKICENKKIARMAILNENDEVKLWNTDNTNGIYPTVYNAKDITLNDSYLGVLKNDGTVSYIDFSKETSELVVSEVPEWNNIISVKAGNHFLAGLTIDGKVRIFGNAHFSIADAELWQDIVKIDVAGNRILGLNIESRMFLAGSDEFGEGDFIHTLKGVKDFAVSELQTMILQTDGTVKLTYNPIGASVEFVNTWKNVKKIAVRKDNFVALTDEGKVLSTIENEVELTTWENIDDIDASDTYVFGYTKMST